MMNPFTLSDRVDLSADKNCMGTEKSQKNPFDTFFFKLYTATVSSYTASYCHSNSNFLTQRFFLNRVKLKKEL